MTDKVPAIRTSLAEMGFNAAFFAVGIGMFVAGVFAMIVTPPGELSRYTIGLAIAGLLCAVGGAISATETYTLDNEGISIGLPVRRWSWRRRVIPWSSVVFVTARGREGEIVEIEIWGKDDTLTVPALDMNATSHATAHFVARHTSPEAWSDSFRQSFGATVGH